MTNLQVSYYYVASPITHPDPKEVASRIEYASYLTAELLQCNIPVFSAAAFYGHLFLRCPKQLKEIDHYEWMALSKPFLESASGLIVLCMAGWLESKGVQEEMNLAQDNRIRLHFWSPAVSCAEFLASSAVVPCA